jgi:hypothetical protein
MTDKLLTLRDPFGSVLKVAARVPARYWFLVVTVVWILCGVVACTSATPVKPYPGSASPTEVIYVISSGWHTELGLPVEALSGPLAALTRDFPSARYPVFGWGAHDYYMAKNPGIADLLRTTAPGPAAMLVIPLQISPEMFFGASNVFVLPSPRHGTERLSLFLWNYLDEDENGAPNRIGVGPYPQSVLYVRMLAAMAGTAGGVPVVQRATAGLP